MVLGPSRGQYAEVTFPKREGEKFCKKSIGNELENLENLENAVAAVSYDALTSF